MDTILRLLRDPALSGGGALASIAMLFLALCGNRRRVVRRRKVSAEKVLELEHSLGHVASPQEYHFRVSYGAIAAFWIAVVLAVWFACYKFWLDSSDIDFYPRTVVALILATTGPFSLSLLALGGTALAKHFMVESKQQEEEYGKIYDLFVYSLVLFMFLFFLLMFSGKVIIERFGS